MGEPKQVDVLGMTTGIVSSFVSNNTVSAADLPGLIRSVHEAISNLSSGETSDTEALSPAVPVSKSITPDFLICLEDGRKLKMLRRYLRSRYSMTPEEYRERWNLPADYPMVAPNYAKLRSKHAKNIGLGKKRNRRPEAPISSINSRTGSASGGLFQSQLLPDGQDRLDQFIHHGRVMHRARRETQTLCAARHSRIVDRLNIDAEVEQQRIGQGLAALRITYQQRHNVRRRIHHRQACVAELLLQFCSLGLMNSAQLAAIIGAQFLDAGQSTSRHDRASRRTEMKPDAMERIASMTVAFEAI